MLASTKTRVAVFLRVSTQSGTSRSNSTQPSRPHDPLSILFCGADEFSIYSLRALRAFQHTRPDQVTSIDVVCRPDKRVGRGLKQIQPGWSASTNDFSEVLTSVVPIKNVANELGLRLHQIDTFKGWTPPDSTNLVIAVSFGLLVPARILNGAKYGGLNVHPSLLPDLRGPGPIVHTLLKRRPYTGVTLQTMHPTKFDEGVILDQTPAPGLPVDPQTTPDKLLHQLGSKGAEMLIHAIERGLLVAPLTGLPQDVCNSGQIDHAPKITPEDRRIDWQTWAPDEIVLRDRVLGRLWDNETYSLCVPGGSAKRVTFHGPWIRASPPAAFSSATPGQPLLCRDEDDNLVLGITTMDGSVVSPEAATIEGGRKREGLKSLIDGIGVE